jgi:hypothetical protein
LPKQCMGEESGTGPLMFRPFLTAGPFAAGGARGGWTPAPTDSRCSPPRPGCRKAGRAEGSVGSPRPRLRAAAD